MIAGGATGGPGGVRRGEMRPRRRDGRLRHGHRPVQRPLRAARRRCPSRSSITSRRRAGPAATGCRGRVRAALFRRRLHDLEVDHREVRRRRPGPAGRRSCRTPQHMSRTWTAIAAARSAGTRRWWNISASRSQAEDCGACDVCLGDTEDVPERDVVAQKILSCVARVQGDASASVMCIDVLRGENTERIRTPRPRQAHHLRPAQGCDQGRRSATGSTSSSARSCWCRRATSTRC